MADRAPLFTGSIVAIVTPMKGRGELDLEAFRHLLEWHAAEGTDGVVVTGTTGESPTLSADEATTLWRTAVETVGRRMTVVAGTGSNDTHHALDLARRAAETGVDGLLVVTPYYNKPTPAGLAAHFRTIADEVDLPICLYNVPSRAGVAIPPDTVAELAAHPRIAALKEAGGSVDRVTEIRQLTDLPILSGDDPLTVPMMAVGAVGVISVTANVAPKKTADKVRAAAEGDFATARRLHEELYPLTRALFLESNPIPAKAALAMAGRIDEVFRLPLTPMAPAPKAKLRQVLEQTGLAGTLIR